MLVPIRRDRTTKPPIGTPLRSDGHWSVQGLMCASVFNEAGGVPLLGEKPATSAVGWNADGISVNASQTAEWLSSFSIPVGDHNAITAICGLTPPNRQNTTGILAQLTTPGGTGWILQQSQAADNRYGIGGTYTTLTFKPSHFVFSSTSTNNIGQIRLTNGSDVFTGTLPNNPIAPISKLQLAPSTTTGDFKYFLLYKRVLNDVEQGSLINNPYQIFDPEIVWVDVGGTTGITGTFAATDSSDTFNISAVLSVSGSLSTTDAADTFAVAGNLSLTGSLAVTDQQDSFSATAGTAENITGSLSATDLPDTFTASGMLEISGTLSATDPIDTALFNGGSGLIGTLAATDSPDTSTVSGTLSISGTLACADTGDLFEATGTIPISGTLTANDGQDTVSFTGTLSSSGVVIITLKALVAGTAITIRSAADNVLLASVTSAGGEYVYTATEDVFVSVEQPVPTAAEIAAEVLNSLNATTIPVDTVKIKGQTITGSGTEADPWGP